MDNTTEISYDKQWSALVLLLATPLALLAQSPSAPKKIGYIDFFGGRGLDVQAIRMALPFREGDTSRPKLADEARSAVERVTGRKATDVAVVCCSGHGDLEIFIGLPGASSHSFTFDPAPTGRVLLAAELIQLHKAMQQAETEAVNKSFADEEDTPTGYRLLKEPKAQAAELALRTYALAHEDEMVRVLTLSADAGQRAVAADALGFGAGTARQAVALGHAASDPDETVRNEAVRAIGEILRADSSASTQIAPDHFIDMVRSGVWTDRNKGSMVLLYLTQSRDPVLLRRIQAEAGDALREMARWPQIGRALDARQILARIDGKSEAWSLVDMAPAWLWTSAALAAFAAGLLAFAFGRFPSKLANGAIALVAPALVSPVLYLALVKVARLCDVSDGLALVFLLPWYLVAAVIGAIVIFARKEKAAFPC